MNSIAENALANAMGVANPFPVPSRPEVPTFIDVIELHEVSAIDTSGPINLVMESEGRRFALDMVESASGDLANPVALAKLVQNLIRAAIGRPPSHAKGIKGVIEALEQLSADGAQVSAEVQL